MYIYIYVYVYICTLLFYTESYKGKVWIPNKDSPGNKKFCFIYDTLPKSKIVNKWDEMLWKNYVLLVWFKWDLNSLFYKFS